MLRKLPWGQGEATWGGPCLWGEALHQAGGCRPLPWGWAPVGAGSLQPVRYAVRWAWCCAGCCRVLLLRWWHRAGPEGGRNPFCAPSAALAPMGLFLGSGCSWPGAVHPCVTRSLHPQPQGSSAEPLSAALLCPPLLPPAQPHCCPVWGCCVALRASSCSPPHF